MKYPLKVMVAELKKVLGGLEEVREALRGPVPVPAPEWVNLESMPPVRLGFGDALDALDAIRKSGTVFHPHPADADIVQVYRRLTMALTPDRSGLTDSLVHRLQRDPSDGNAELEALIRLLVDLVG